jgi:hypothetical protein
MSKNVEMKLLLTADEAKTWFNENNIYAELEPNGINLDDTIINRLYETAQEFNQSCPIVAHYNRTLKGFAFRKWVGVLCAAFVGFDMYKKCGHYKGLHNTQLADKFFPNATEQEICIAQQHNVNLGMGAYESISYVTNGKTAEPGNKQQQIVEYCTSLSTLNIDWSEQGYTSGLDEIGYLHKLPFGDKATEDWYNLGSFTKSPNYTPKTDLVATTGERISVKKVGGSQLMSAAINEALATVVAGMNHIELSDDYRRKVLEIFNEYPVVNTPECDARIEYCNQIVNEYIATHRELKHAILLEALTGNTKFGKDSLSSATHVYVFDEFYKSTLYTCEEYAEKVVDDAKIYFAYKSHSGEKDRYVSFRMNVK